MHIGVVATIPNFADRLQREGKPGLYYTIILPPIDIHNYIYIPYIPYTHLL